MKKQRITERKNGQYVIRDTAQYSLHDLVQLAGKWETQRTISGFIGLSISVMIVLSIILLLIAGLKSLIGIIF